MKLVRVLSLLMALTSFTWAAEFDEEEDAPPESVAPVEVVSPETATETSVDAAESAPTESTVTALESEAAAAETGEGASAPVPEPSVVAQEEGGAPGASHRVVSGDTLWDLAGSYLKNPFLWPQILEANRGTIQNPDLIFPDQEFVIPMAGAAEAPAAVAETPLTVDPPVVAAEVGSAEEEFAPVAPDMAEDLDAESTSGRKMVDAAPEEEAAPNPSAEEEMVEIKKKVGAARGAGFMGGVADTFVADENWEYDGYVVRDRDQRMMISQGDIVYLNIGAASGVKPKMTAHVFRVGKKVRDPYQKKKMGRLVKRVGTAMVTGHVSDEGCTAVIINSLEPIRVGDIVKFIAR